MPKMCSTCGSISSVESGFTKYGFEQDAIPLPRAVTSLEEVVSDISGGRGHTLYRCGGCGAFFDYELDYEFIIPGTEDTETLTRISDDQAAVLRSRIESNNKKRR